ncbi:MAG: DUF2064 domain-containing protein [Alphaproteobacteria bacterium]
MSAAIAVFAKTPELSPVKTRLAASIGKERAEEFYGLCLAVVEDVLDIAAHRIKPPLTPFWAVAEQNGLVHPAWQNMDRMWTGEGSLGERLHHVYFTLRKNYGTVLLIGTDSPQLCVRHIEQATTHLAKHKGFVMGKALDGGFYLFGGNVDVAKEIWTQTPYSVENTSAVLSQKLSLQADIHYLNELSDVDVIEDLRALLRHRAAMTLPSQRKLIRWIDNYFEYHQLSPFTITIPPY